MDIPDTTLDSKTFKVMAEFQKDSGIRGLGVLDIVTQKALNNALDKIILENDKQYQKAVWILKVR